MKSILIKIWKYLFYQKNQDELLDEYKEIGCPYERKDCPSDKHLYLYPSIQHDIKKRIKLKLEFCEYCKARREDNDWNRKEVLRKKTLKR